MQGQLLQTISWKDASVELSLGVLSKIEGYEVTGSAQNGFLFTVVLDDVEAGTYKITEKNSAIEGFVAKPWRFDRYESWRHFNKGRR